jgi:hypothetical protein
MTDTITIGRKLIPLDHIAFIEPFEPSEHTRIRTEKDFKARVVLIDRESALTEETTSAFAEAHAFRMLEEDAVATNPAVHFRVESFAPGEGFQPRKPYRSRLLWRDYDGNQQSKLLLSPPEMVLRVAVRGEAAVEPDAAEGRSAPLRSRTTRPRTRRSRRRETPGVSPI